MTSEPQPLSRGERLAVAAILLLAFCLRLIRLGVFPYWHDEVHNLIASEDLYALVVHGNLISNHPPLPYILVAFWRAIGFGGSEWTMRLLPVAFGIGAVGAVFALGRRLFNVRAGLFAAFLLAISPLHVHHSQDLKEYIYLPFVATVMVLWFYRAMDSGRMRDWIIYGLLAGLACYTEIFVGPLLVAINLWALPLLVGKRALWRGWLTGNILGATLFVPWLGIMFRKAVGTMVKAENWWVPPPSPTGVGFFFKAVAFGYTAPKPWFELATVLYLALVVTGIAVAWRTNRRGAALLVIWATVPVAIVYGVSLITQSIFLIRAMLPYAMALYVLAGVGLAGIRPRSLRAVSFGAVCFLVGTGLVHHYQRDYTAFDYPHRPGTHPPRDYAKAAQYILSQWQDGDVVIHTSAATWLPFFWYGFRDRPQYFAGVGGKFIADIQMGNPRNTTDPKLENYWPREPQLEVQGAKRVWFVFGEWERKYLPGNATDVYRWMDGHFSEVGAKTFMGIDVLLYRPASDAVAVKRDNDDGAACDVGYAGDTAPYRQVRLDNGLVLRSEAERQGSLVVRWENTAVADSEMASFAQTAQKKQVVFSIVNTSTHPVESSATFFASDALIDGAAFYETSPSDEIWHVYAQHNPVPPPDHFEGGVAAAAFDRTGENALTGTVSLAAGAYRVFVYALGTPGDADHGRAGVTVSVGDAKGFSQGTGAAPGLFTWGWCPGELVTVPGGPLPLQLLAVASAAPAYADVKAVALVRQRVDSRKAAVESSGWPGKITLSPGETRSFTATVDTEIARTDLWVYEYGFDGKDYRIFALH